MKLQFKNLNHKHICCSTLFHWGSLLSQESRIELRTFPQESKLHVVPFKIQTFLLLLLVGIQYTPGELIFSIITAVTCQGSVHNEDNV